MDWEFLAVAPMPPQSHLLHGCWLEAERADRVALGLEGLRNALDQSFHAHMIAVTEEIRLSATRLRDLAHQSGVHKSRAPAVADHLVVLLPCMSKTLRDISAYYDDKAVSRELRWRKMYHEMMKEAGGLSLPQRFLLYNHLLALLLCLLTHDRHLDRDQLAMLRQKVLDLRERRGIPPPTAAQQQQQAPPPLPTTTTSPDQVLAAAAAGGGARGREAALALAQRERQHWCERVFAQPLSSRTDMSPGAAPRSCVYSAPPLVPAWDPARPRTRRTLMRRAFLDDGGDGDGDRLSVRFFVDVEDTPYLEVRVQSGGSDGPQGFAWKGHHEVWARRDGPALVLKRWSRSAAAWRTWVVLGFVTWEELVLFHCAFTALKARNPLAPVMNPAEFKLRGENLLFQAQIIDDDYKHSLIVYQDERTAGIRLHAAVWNGELRQCPVWTAFVTHLSLSSSSWLVRVSRHTFHVKDIQLYVFCQKYKESRMRKNKDGAFEIYFVSKTAADQFAKLFASLIAIPDPSEVGRDSLAGPSHG